MAITTWLQYADHALAPLCRSPNGSNMPIADTTPYTSGDEGDDAGNYDDRAERDDRRGEARGEIGDG
jgi:hypothetical protein